MRTFARCLNRLLNAQNKKGDGISKNELIRQTRIDRGSFYKIINGTRNPTMEQYRLIRDHLTLSHEEKAELEHACILDREGEEVWTRRQNVQRCMAMLTKSAYAERLMEESKLLQTARIDPAKKYYASSAEIADLIAGLIEQNFHKDEVHIDLLTPVLPDILKAEILQGMKKQWDKKVRVRHIIRFHRKVRHLDVRILEELKSSLYFAASRFDGYELYYSFDSAEQEGEMGDLFPYAIILDDSAVLSSQDTGLLITDTESLQALRVQFETRLGGCERLAMAFSGLDAYYAYNDVLKKESRTFFYEYAFCLSMMADADKLAKYVSEPYREMILGHINVIHSYVPEADYVSLEGIIDFAQTGEIREIAPGIIKPVDIEDRILALQELRRGLGSYYYIVDEQYLPVMDMWNVIVRGGDSVQMNLQGEGIQILMITAENIVTAFEDYMFALKDSVDIMPREDADAAILQLIQELEEIRGGVSA